MTTTIHPTTTGNDLESQRGHGTRGVRLAGYGFVTAWIVGLAVNPSGPAIDAPDADIAAHYSTHATSALGSEFLIHGVAAVCLGVVVAAVVRHARTAGRPSRLYERAGALAVGVSAAQALTGVAAVAASNAGTIGTLFDLLNRLDGVKLLLLAAAGLASIRILGGWAARVSAVMVLTLIVGGVGYLFLVPSVSVAAAPALLLLLVWVASSGRQASAKVA
jgi:hypothetical protein